MGRRLAEALGLGEGAETPAAAPGHRVPFHWPPHPVSYGFRVASSDWRETTELHWDGEMIEIRIAVTEHGHFGRWEELWLEARGTSEHEMLESLLAAAEPMLARQRAIAAALGLEGRFRGSVGQLGPEGLLRLLYCPDRDVAREAQGVIEQRGHGNDWGPALRVILTDRRHPHRRIAQWCVLDICEDLPGVVEDEPGRREIVEAIGGLLRDARDDYARAVFKAGTVLGGHLPAALGEPPLRRALAEGTPIGRRAAIHGMYHVAEWAEDRRPEIATLLREHAVTESEPLLAEYARLMARDVERAEPDHADEPRFPDEP